MRTPVGSVDLWYFAPSRCMLHQAHLEAWTRMSNKEPGKRSFTKTKNQTKWVWEAASEDRNSPCIAHQHLLNMAQRHGQPIPRILPAPWNEITQQVVLIDGIFMGLGIYIGVKTLAGSKHCGCCPSNNHSTAAPQATTRRLVFKGPVTFNRPENTREAPIPMTRDRMTRPWNGVSPGGNSWPNGTKASFSGTKSVIAFLLSQASVIDHFWPLDNSVAASTSINIIMPHLPLTIVLATNRQHWFTTETVNQFVKNPHT